MSLPTEILQLVIEDFISQHSNRQTEFVPQWYLTPLLRVCRQWHEVTEAYLYREISVGNKIWHPIRPMKDESVTDYRRRYAAYEEAMSMKRQGNEIAEDLLATLTTSSQLAALVRTLRLGIEVDSSEAGEREWTRKNIRILQLCRNVEHIEIRGFDHAELDALVEALKTTSLVTFCISKQETLPWPPPRKVGRFTQLFDLLQSWPRLRSIRVEAFLADEAEEDPFMFDVTEASPCPNLQEIILPGTALHDFEFRALHSICGSLTKLSISLFGKRVGDKGQVAAETLYECLRAWSPTLEYLKIDAPDYRNADQRLSEAIGSLKALRELQITKLKLDLASISRLSPLERFATLSDHRWEEVERLLECFPSLIDIAVDIRDLHEKESRMKEVCARRKVKLRNWTIGYDIEEYDPAPDAGFLL